MTLPEDCTRIAAAKSGAFGSPHLAPERASGHVGAITISGYR